MGPVVYDYDVSLRRSLALRAAAPPPRLVSASTPGSGSTTSYDYDDLLETPETLPPPTPG
jgi:hypothetical protein